MKNILIKNATIATSKDVFKGDLLIENELIKEVAPQINAGSNIDIVNADGLFLLPGGVDPHTHFDLDNGQMRTSDDFYTGSIAAACGGTTTVIDHMAFGPANCPLTHQPEVYHKLAKPAVVDYGFHGTIQHVDEQVLHDMEVLKQQGITSLKLYLTYGFRLQDDDVLKVLQRAHSLGIIVCVHAENDAIVTQNQKYFIENGKTSAKYHPLSRPDEAEAEAVFRTLMLARSVNNTHIYIVHLSTMLGLNAVQLARKAGQKNIFAETCPQYMFLTDDLYDAPDGLKYIMSPPLRKQASLDALWQGVIDGDIETIGTDHCPFFYKTQKQTGKNNFTKAPGGAPGVQLRMALMFSEGYNKGKLSLPQVVQQCCTRPAEIFGIAPKKGDIQVGADADLVLFNPNAEWTVTQSLLHENVDYTPYEGMQLKGRPVMTFSRGELIAQNGNFVGKKGRGQFLKRNSFK